MLLQSVDKTCKTAKQQSCQEQVGTDFVLNRIALVLAQELLENEGEGGSRNL